MPDASVAWHNIKLSCAAAQKVRLDKSVKRLAGLLMPKGAIGKPSMGYSYIQCLARVSTPLHDQGR